MSDLRKRLPLRFKHHDAFLEINREGAGWSVQSYVDGRVLGTAHCSHRRHVELHHARVQEWLNAAERDERTVAPLA